MIRSLNSFVVGILFLAFALDDGKGQLAIIGRGTWLRPDDFAQGDNRQLLENIIDWLGRC